jgi:hypothetical protein
MKKTNNNVIPLKQAQDWAANWQKDNTLKAFLIQKDNIDSIIEAGGDLANFRGYLAIDETGNPTLLLVGVDSDGCDMIDEREDLFVYDANKPCPAHCDPTSPLFKP